MTRKELAQAIYSVSHLTGTFLLRSGITSHEYFDKYQFESQPAILNEIASHMKNLLPESYDYLAALEMGGIPLATALSLQTGKPVIFVRKKAKQYGTCKFAEGPDIRGKNLVIIEDVVTSGGQIVLSSDDLRSQGANITLALCVIDRETGGPKALAEKDIEFKSLFTMTEIKSLL